MFDVTLQINLSPGDIDYAELTVPPLVNAHRDFVKEVIAIVDCCRPQRTKFVNPNLRFPSEKFCEGVKEISRIVEELKKEGLLDQIIYLHKGDELLFKIAKKYMRNLVYETHDAFAHALIAYLVGIEVPSTRYVVHSDADMLLFQENGYNWVNEAVYLMEYIENKYGFKMVFATPRICPPLDKKESNTLQICLDQNLSGIKVEGGWVDKWFSTRFFLVDKLRFSQYLPLLKGRTLVEVLARKYLRRSYPMSPEFMFYHRVGKSGGYRLHLNSEKAWLLHPKDKGGIFKKLLPRVLSSVSRGCVPTSQRGYSNIVLSYWKEFL